MSQYGTGNLFEKEQAEQADTPTGRVIRVAFESGVDAEFDYLLPEKLAPVELGRRVEAPFGRANKLLTGFCVCADVPAEKSFTARGKGRKLKTVKAVVDSEPLLDKQLMALARWISEYYVCPLGQVLAAMVPAAVKKGAGVKTQRHVYLAIDSDEIEKTMNRLRGKKQKQIIEILRQRKAYDSDHAVEISALLTEIGCKSSPLNGLAQKRIVRIAQKQVLSSLPAVPESMAVKTEKVRLNADQQKALEYINAQINSGKFAITLLHGVTDSGKTEVYIRAIEQCRHNGKSAIVLLPEIALTAQTVQRFSSRFDKIAVLHSGLTAAQRNVQWQNIKAGRADVVIGARSAVFAPLTDLGLIIVDEEHEPSYKQDTVPRYHGRDVAIKRTQLSNAHCILGSATPSLETLSNCKTRTHFTRVTLPKRVMDLPSPEMLLVDMRAQPTGPDGVNLISRPLAERLVHVLAKSEQAILLLNRRGYSNFVYCPSCKYTVHCKNCDVTLTFHKSKMPRPAKAGTVLGKHMDYGYAVCHHCLSQTLVPEKCPLCKTGLAMIGLGSQRLEEQLNAKFPSAKIARVDSDSMAGKDYYHVLADFAAGRIDILAGTQMLAKGLHFPNVTLVGIISADTSLYLPDFRANERTFQLICQVAGRAGRSQKKGTVYVQTFLPDQPAIRFAVENDFAGFVAEELKHRTACNLPPLWRMAAVLLRDTKYEKLEAAAAAMRQRIDDCIQRQQLKAVVRGPVPAVISRLQRYHRMQIIIQAPNPAIIQRLFACLRAGPAVRPAVITAVDVDPVNLL